MIAHHDNCLFGRLEVVGAAASFNYEKSTWSLMRAQMNCKLSRYQMRVGNILLIASKEAEEIDIIGQLRLELPISSKKTTIWLTLEDSD